MLSSMLSSSRAGPVLQRVTVHFQWQSPRWVPVYLSMPLFLTCLLNGCLSTSACLCSLRVSSVGSCLPQHASVPYVSPQWVPVYLSMPMFLTCLLGGFLSTSACLCSLRVSSVGSCLPQHASVPYMSPAFHLVLVV